jgi:hypothetical protein
MPSPFPGFDPFLEGSIWSTVHAQLSSEIARQLTPKLAPKYVTLAAEWFVLDADDDGVAVATAKINPDIGVARSRSDLLAGPTAVLEAPLHLATVMPVRTRQITIEIREVARHRLVTAIEVLSPANKRSPGRKEYLAKRQRLLFSRAHLMEIDLLRRGRRVPMREPLPDDPYFILLSRVEKRPVTDIWPIGLRDRLPVVPVPLLPGDPDVPLDLQTAFDTIYDSFRFDLLLDYDAGPRVPLSAEDAAWAAQVRGRKAQ